MTSQNAGRNNHSEQNPMFGVILGEMEDSKKKALDALARYKFWMFGYHAAAWVKYNGLLPSHLKQENPFSDLVRKARDIIHEPERIAYLKKCEEEIQKAEIEKLQGGQ